LERLSDVRAAQSGVMVTHFTVIGWADHRTKRTFYIACYARAGDCPFGHHALRTSQLFERLLLLTESLGDGAYETPAKNAPTNKTAKDAPAKQTAAKK
jgi:hypothetical protein